MMLLDTPRLRLKPHTPDKLQRLHAWDRDPELTFLNDDEGTQETPPTLDETRAYLERMCHYDPAHGVLHCAIHLRAGDTFIGYGMIAAPDHHNRSCWLGITIGERPLWGQGLAHEAPTRVIDYAFASLEMKRIGADVFALNTRSIRLFEGFGFRRKGLRRESVWKLCRFEDELLYGLLRREWPHAPPPPEAGVN
jgi:RimJ/RimL family protein N-acetyltransferase